MYSEDKEGPLATDYRRGSVGAAANRENNAARDFSDGFYFRRARFGVEGTFARDFNYRLLLELGGSGTEGPTRINDAWVGYTGFAPFTFLLGAFSPSANMDDGTTPEDLPFLERASASELSRSLGGADGRIGLA
ncbi:MAG TPA: porin [Steroidobacteraceae bacterium]|nr:porin [Steroidobacteraceae bacterium]